MKVKKDDVDPTLPFYRPSESEPMRRVGACEACGTDTSWIVGASPTCSAPCAERYEGLRRLRDPEPFTDSRLGFNLQNIKRRPT